MEYCKEIPKIKSTLSRQDRSYIIWEVESFPIIKLDEYFIYLRKWNRRKNICRLFFKIKD